MNILFLFSVFILFMSTNAQDWSMCPGTSKDAVNSQEALDYRDDPKLPIDFYAYVIINSYGNADDEKNSTAAEYKTDGNNGGVVYYSDGQVITEFHDYQRKQVTFYSYRESDKEKNMCTVENATDVYNWNLGMGYHEDLVSNGADFFFRFRDRKNKLIGKAIYKGNSSDYGIDVDVWSECLYWPEADATINLTFSWSNNDTWKPLSGKTPKGENYRVPVRINVNAKGKFGSIKQDAFVAHFWQDSSERPELLSVPENTICVGLSSGNRKIPKLPTHFSFAMEIATMNPDSLVETEVVYQWHWFDQELNLTRFDKQSPSEHIDTEKETDAGIISEIHDFNTGMAYTIDRSVGKCDVTTISANSIDATIEKGKIVVSDPKKLLQIDNLDFTWYKKTKVRGIPADQFRAFDGALVHELYTSTDTDVIEGTHIWNHRQPLKYSLYELQNAKLHRVDQNIFNFDKDRPDIFLYDISSCSEDSDKRRFQFRMAGTLSQIGLYSVEQFKRDVMFFIWNCTKVSYLRIAHIELISHRDHTHVSFTMLEKVDSSKVPNEPTTDEAIKKCADKMNSQDLYVVVPGTQLVVTVAQGTLRELYTETDGTKPTKPTGSGTTKSAGSDTSDSDSGTTKSDSICNSASSEDSGTKYSPGSMAALGICMILIGFFGAFGILYYLKPRFFQRGDHSVPAMRFANEEIE